MNLSDERKLWSAVRAKCALCASAAPSVWEDDERFHLVNESKLPCLASDLHRKLITQWVQSVRSIAATRNSQKAG